MRKLVQYVLAHGVSWENSSFIFSSNNNLWTPSSIAEYQYQTRATTTQCDEGTGGVQLATPLGSTASDVGDLCLHTNCTP